MKQTFILWISACVITFLAGYLNSALSGDYPVTGTIGINGKKVSYNFARIFNTKEHYKVLLRSDADSLKASVQWRYKNQSGWNEIPMKDSANIFSASLPVFKINYKLEYRIRASKDNRNYFLPENKPVEMRFRGKVPSTIMALYYMTLLGGLLLSTRTGLDYFKENNHIRRLSLLTLTAFFLYTLFVSPVKTTFELDVMTNGVPFITELFNLQSLIFFLLWIAGMIFAFKSPKFKMHVLIISAITLIVYLVL